MIMINNNNIQSQYNIASLTVIANFLYTVAEIESVDNKIKNINEKEDWRKL